jgi:transcriptional regulator with GAF, ATPase, and Fis domain
MQSQNETNKLEQIIGGSRVMKQVKSEICKIADYPWPVLILGESGVGKELAARALHDLSPRREKPFVAVNCAGMPDTLTESEFFGYEKGAFTGAEVRKKGKFEEADGGTVFLDEIGEASVKCQVTLLRVLETRTVTRIGGWKEIPVNAGVICATNKPVHQLVNDMRTDLFHRITSYLLHIPPLRERKEDIPELVAHFIRHFQKEFLDQTGKKLSISKIDEKAVKYLMRLNLCGNVRELRNILQRGVMLSEAGDTVLAERYVRRAAACLPQPGNDEAGDALRYLYEWAAANQSRFWNRHRKVNRQPKEGWSGRWDLKRIRKNAGTNRDSPDKDEWKEICFTAEAISKLLEEDFDKKSVIQTWGERGWLNGSKDHTSKACRIDEQMVRCCCFKRKAVERVIFGQSF